MSRLLYFDCFSGISGDMVLGALVDAGLPMVKLTEALGSLAVDGYLVHAERVLRAGVSATKFIVHEHGARDSGLVTIKVMIINNIIITRTGVCPRSTS